MNAWPDLPLWLATAAALAVLTILPVWWSRRSSALPRATLIACSFFASFLSTNTLLGQAGYGYRAGLTWMVGAAVFVACGAVAWFVVAGPLVRDAKRVLGHGRDPDDLTLPLYLSEKYASPGLGYLSAAVILVASAVYVTAVYTGVGHALRGILGLSYSASIWLIAAVVATYTAWGMVRAILHTDLAQTIAVVAASITLFAVTAGHADWSAFAATGNEPNEWLAWGARVSPLWAFGVAFSVGIKLILAPRLLVRFLLFSHAEPQQVRRAGWIAVGLMLLCFPLLYSLGVLAHGVIPASELAYYAANTDDVVPYLVRELCTTPLAAIVLVGLICAALSSVDSAVHVAGCALVIDLSAARRAWPLRRRRKWQRIAMVVAALVPAFVALDAPAGVVPLVAASGAIIGSTLAGPVLLGLIPKYATKAGAMTGLVVGGASAAVWAAGLGAAAGAPDLHAVFVGILAGVLSQIACSDRLVLVRLLFRTKEIEPKSLDSARPPADSI